MKKNFKNFIIIGLVIILILSTLIIFILSNKITREITGVEKIKLEESGNEIGNYLEMLQDLNTNDYSNYIIFALEYNLNENSDNTLTLAEIETFISNTLLIDVSEKDFEVGISPNMLEKQITYSPTDETYTINNKKSSSSEIANIPITKYVINDIQKKNDNYTIFYTKYTINNPYDILNYYENTSANHGIINEIKEYLNGEKSMNTIRKYINEELINNYAEKGNSVKVELVYQNEKLLINNIG